LEEQVSLMKKTKKILTDSEESRLDSSKPLPLPLETDKEKEKERIVTESLTSCSPSEPIPNSSSRKSETSLRKSQRVKYVSIEQFEKQKNRPASPPLPLAVCPSEQLTTSTPPMSKPAWQLPQPPPANPHPPINSSPFVLKEKGLGRPSRSGSLDSQPSNPALTPKTAIETRNRGNSLTLDSFIQHQTPKKKKQTRDTPLLATTLLASPSSSSPQAQAQKSEVNPWKTPEKFVSALPSPLPPQSSPAIAAATAGAPRSSLQEIQQEEERVRKGSYIKTLQGNTTPWLMDRQSAQISSLEDVMKCQMKERERLLEQQELEEALAAVARLEEEEAKKKKKSEESKRKGQRKKGVSQQDKNHRQQQDKK
jgi:hypothetical protein